MREAIYPGSFDPVTEGHLDIIKRGAKIFDRLVVAVMINQRKSVKFTPDERVDMLKRVTGGIPNVKVVSSEMLLAEFARVQNIHVIIKGLRAVSDFEHEFQMALINNKLNPEIDTLFLTPSERFMYLSSSVVKEVASYGGDISQLVPAEVLEQIRERLGGVSGVPCGKESGG